MTNSAAESPECSEATANNERYYEPCSCCRALAQVRMPVFDPNAPDISHHQHGQPGQNGKRKPIVFKFPGLSNGKNGGENGNKNGANASGTGSGKNAAGLNTNAATLDPTSDATADSAKEATGGATRGAGNEAPGDTGKEAASDEWHSDLDLPKKRKLWQGLDGMAVMAFGVIIPALMGVASCMSAPKRITLLLLNHPVETSAELLLLAAIPLAIFFLWSSLCRNNVSYSLWRGVALGTAIGTAIITAAVCVAALFYGSSDLASAIGTDFTTGFCWIAFLSIGAAAIGFYLVHRMRLARDFSASRLQVVAFTVVGLLLSIVTFIGAEYRPWTIRLAELKAVSTQPEERNAGLTELRALDPERELRMECSDARAAGLSGLFIPLKPNSQRELYFAVTGKPYSLREFNNKDISFMADDDLKRRIVGERVPGLSLVRSSMDGVVHPDTLASTLNWTFVFKNSSQSPQEARTELGLPPGAVITGLTLWNHGEPQAAAVAAAGKAEGYTDSTWTQVNHDGPAIISDIGHGRMLLHCYPVQQEEELKVSVTMVIPLKPDGSKAASLILPTFIATNFDFNAKGNLLKLRSPSALSSTAKNLSGGVLASGEKTITGTLTDQQLEVSNLNITAARNELTKPVIMLDKMAIKLAQQDEKRREEKRRIANELNSYQAERQIIVMIDGSKGVNGQIADVTKALNGKPAGRFTHKPQIKVVPPHYVVEKVTRVAAPAPKHLVIVVDGSATVKPFAGELSAALAKLPSGIPTDVIIASQEKDKSIKPVSLAQGLAELKKTDFIGGQNNLQSVVNAAEIAGERKGGAVLWVHGPQPSLNEEIYIMSQYAATPAFYELQVGSGDIDTFDFFKNHSEIGPFSQVPRNSTSLTADLATFFSKWKPDSNDYTVSLSETTVRPDDAVAISDQEADELIALNASQECSRLVSDRRIRSAARLAVAYGVVTPVSCALVSNNTRAVEEPEGDAFASLPNGENAQGVPGASTVSSAPALQGATNGTIAPQGVDATYVTGVNTAGTVRVNNLANLEALLNIIANLAEIGCALVGAVILLHGFARREPLLTEIMGREIEFSAGQRIAFGICLIIAGLAVPGLINWFVASARDANLFS